jgi:hypothetical protein
MKEMGGYRLAIALMTKGAVNHVHRREVVEALRRHEVDVTFIVRDDYLPLIERMQGCRYVSCRVTEPRAPLAYRCLRLARRIRRLSPADDASMRLRMRIVYHDERSTVFGRAGHWLREVLARSRTVMRLVVALEGLLVRSQEVEGLDPSGVDQLLLLGLGTSNTELDGALTWWARRHGLATVHLVVNYDGLSSKGFRGVPVERLLVWGPSMAEDARDLQAISETGIRVIGAVRYDGIELALDRDTFLRRCRLDPAKRTICFAGGIFAFHYFEMLEILRLFREQGQDYQLILRVYPNKRLLDSPYMPALQARAAGVPGVYISIGDPHYASGARDRDVMYIEEHELWHALRYSDVVVNLYSTIGLEACMFDRPVINMWYHDPMGHVWLRGPMHSPRILYVHHRKLLSYGGTTEAASREELMTVIEDALAHPERRREGRRRAVDEECGVLDGKACERLAEACVEAFRAARRRGGG